ncbi:Protein IMPACT-like protein [Aphelenchoides fujianensis]|nr:Protein IMPACT-like protein [Aphelenchoides fujianensis]
MTRKRGPRRRKKAASTGEPPAVAVEDPAPPPPLSAEAAEEVELVASAFSDLVRVLDDGRLHVQLPLDVEVIFRLPAGYPTECPPQHNVLVPAFLTAVQRKIHRRLEENYAQLAGGSLLITCIADLEAIVREAAAEQKATREAEIAVESKEPDDEQQPAAVAQPKERRFPWRSGPCLEDRKSVFQAHFVEIKSRDDAMAALAELKENAKIARATHNIYAYRCLTPDGLEVADCADDGEDKAGARLLNMIRLMHVTDAMVVVSRWYGGIHLSTDRFRHICNLARELIVEERTAAMAAAAAGSKPKK